MTARLNLNPLTDHAREECRSQAYAQLNRLLPVIGITAPPTDRYCEDYVAELVRSIVIFYLDGDMDSLCEFEGRFRGDYRHPFKAFYLDVVRAAIGKLNS